MLAIGFGVFWIGYSVGYYGWNRITGGNDTFKSLVWPGAYKPTARDGGTAPAASSPAPSVAGQGTNPSAGGSSGFGGASGAIHP